jgi:hypothetical protein
MISICLATRERPEAFLDMCKSAIMTADRPHKIEFVSYHDEDDDFSDYKYIGNHTEVVGKRRTISEMMNRCFHFAKGDIYMYIADDFVFKTYGWDTDVRAAFEQSRDKIILVCPNNKDWSRWGFGVVGFVHRKWIETLGYFIPTFLGECPDRWLSEIAKSLNRDIILNKVYVEHKNIRDEVHKNKVRTSLKHKWSKKYYDQEMIKQRELDTEKLRKVIEDAKPNTRTP